MYLKCKLPLAKTLLKCLTVLIMIVCAGIVMWFAFHPQQVEILLQWVRSSGIWGNLVLILALIISSLPIAIGYTALALVCGFIYGIFEGALTVLIGASLLGCSISFWICGHLGRDYVASKIASTKTSHAFVKAIRNNGFKITVLFRFTPIPLGIQNALFAVCGIPYRVFIVATVIGMFPEALLWCYLGHTAQTLTDVLNNKTSFGTAQQILVSVEVIAVILLGSIIIYFVRKSVREVIDKYSDDEHDIENTLPLVDDNAEIALHPEPRGVVLNL